MTAIIGAPQRFEWEYTGQKLAYRFDQDVDASLDTSDLLLTNLTPGTMATPAQTSLDKSTATEFITFPGIAPYAGAAMIPDGNDEAILNADGITNAAGEHLDGNGDGIKVLRRNLKAAGVEAPASAAAHHLVAHGAEAADPARQVLQDVGIDINEAGNGMFLPIEKKRAVVGLPTHSKIHNDDYYDAVNTRLLRPRREGGPPFSMLSTVFAKIS